jgi:enamine deaminase RidA (YjgF/YER057c/UK114 family)
MSKLEHLNPPEIFSGEPLGFTQVVTSPPGKTVHVSGQVAWDRERKLVGGSDLGAQARQALANLRAALAAAGASSSDVVSTRVYIVDYEPQHAAVVGSALGEFFAGGPPPASTWIGVAALASPDFRIEIEATAVIPD